MREHVYATAAKPGTLDEAIVYFMNDLDMRFPLAELFSSQLAETLPKKVRAAYDVGQESIAGVPCDHLALRGDWADLRLWIAQGDQPLPHRLVLTYKNAEGQPQFWAQFNNWNLSPDVPDSLFVFTPPGGGQGGGGGRGGSGSSRSGAASSGTFGAPRSGAGSVPSSGVASSGTWQANRSSMQASSQASRAQQQASRQQQQASSQSSRESNARELQSTRSQDKATAREDGQSYGTQRQEDRQSYGEQARNQRQDYADDYYGSYPVGAGLAVATGVAVGTAITASAFQLMSCPMTPVVVNGVSFYQCGSTWYQPAYQGNSVTYIVVNPPQ
jgi:hypothetical protein